MSVKILEILNMVSDELRDSRETKYSRTSLLFKLKEAATQFASESKILKHEVQIKVTAGVHKYSLPRFGIPFKDYSGSPLSATVADSFVVPTYLSLIRLGWRDFSSTGENKLLRPNSTFERDEVGSSFNKSGVPLYHYNDEMSFYEFGVWPVPDAAAIDAGASPAADRRLQVNYVRDVLYFSDEAATTTVNPSALTENDYMDPNIPDEFLRKMYLLVCYLRLKNSADAADVQKAANYKALYTEELLNKALQSGSHMDRYNKLKVQE